MSVVVRPGTPADAAVILRFIKELAEYERQPDAVIVAEDTLATQLAEIPPPFEALIAEVGGQTVGFAVYCYSYSTWQGRRGIYLEDLYVTPDHRKSGAGRALMIELAGIARARGCGRLEWAVLDWNQPAIDFYARMGAGKSEWLGFRLVGEDLQRLADGLV